MRRGRGQRGREGMADMGRPMAVRPDREKERNRERTAADPAGNPVERRRIPVRLRFPI